MESRPPPLASFAAGIAVTVVALIAIEPLFASDAMDPPPAIRLEGIPLEPAPRPAREKRNRGGKVAAPGQPSTQSDAAPAASTPVAPTAPGPSGSDFSPAPSPRPRPEAVAPAPAPAAPAPAPSGDDDDDDDDGPDDD